MPNYYEIIKENLDEIIEKFFYWLLAILATLLAMCVIILILISLNIIQVV